MSVESRCCHAAANVVRSCVLRGGYLGTHRIISLSTRSVLYRISCVCKNRAGHTRSPHALALAVTCARDDRQGVIFTEGRRGMQWTTRR